MLILPDVADLTESEIMELKAVSNETGFISIFDMANTLNIFEDMAHTFSHIRHKVYLEQSR